MPNETSRRDLLVKIDHPSIVFIYLYKESKQLSILNTSYMILIVRIQYLSTEYLQRIAKNLETDFLVYKNVKAPKTEIRMFIYDLFIKH